MADLPDDDEIRQWRAATSAAADQHLSAMTEPEVLEAAHEFAIATVRYALILRGAGFDRWQVTAALCGGAIQVAGEALENT